MASKILHWLGLSACVLLIISCFLPWAYYKDIDTTFTGFYSLQNHYGKPGLLLSLIATLVFILTLLPKIWAKRANLFLGALAVGYAIKSFVLFTSCYNAYCPERRIGIYLMLGSTIVMLIATIFPDMKIREEG